MNVSIFDNSAMSKNHPDFKTTQIFDWDSEPKDERPSEFHSTGFSTASGYYHSLDGLERTAPARKPRGNAITILLLGLVTAIGIGTVGVLWLAQFLRG